VTTEAREHESNAVTKPTLANAGAIGLVLLASAAAAYFPSRRAAQVDPATTLRFE